MKIYVKCLLALSLLCGVHSWDKEELEIFDLVEEINRNFYELMGISQAATGQEIKRAFRNLSIVLHPDKNDAEDANIQFRNLVSVYEVLKDPSKREKYDKVLKEGLPNWKSALYYYRRMRKVGLYEGSLIIFVIISIGQYLFAWAAYVEKKYTAEQVIGSRLKKLQKKNKNLDLDAILNEIPAPSILNTLPFQIPMFFWNLPTTIKSGFIKANELKEAALEKRRLEAEEIKRQQELEEEIEEMARIRKEKKENIRKRRQATKAPEKTDAELAGYSKIQAKEYSESDAMKPVLQKSTPLSGGFWTDEDLAELIRLVKKYPGGASSRWETIAETMNRSVQEVTFMAAKMKENGYRIPGQTESVAENIVQDSVVKKEKVKKVVDKTILIPETNWSQEQQRALESAIVKYRKTANSDRWQKIANCVPEKTKEECLHRYKYLCDLVKSQKNKTVAGSDDEKNKEEDDVAEAPTSATSQRVQELGEDDGAQADIGDEEEDEQKEVEMEPIKSKGKRRNKRKERKRRRDFSSDEDSDDAYNYEEN